MNFVTGGARAALLASASLLAAGVAHAQASGGGATQVEEIVVVGSQIQGAKPTEALPVTVVSKDQIAAVGAVSGDDLFRSIPQAGDVQFQEARTTGNLNDARGDTASINLRNLGTGNTLVLLNGRRMVAAPGTQTENFVPVQTVNMNSLPIGATQRVEILRDGAGAIYGSDAVAGVVNVVLDKHFEGVRLDTRFGGSEGTNLREGSVNVEAGKTFSDDTRVMLFGSFTNRSHLLASERDYTASENHLGQVVGTPFAGDTAFDNRSTSSPWGAFTVIPSSTVVRQNGTALTSSGVFHVEPTSNTAAGCSSTVYSGNLCLKSGAITGTADRALRYDENPDRSLLGDLKRYNAFATASHEFDFGEFFSEAGYYHATLDGMREQSAPLSSAVISVPASNYWNPFGPTSFNGVANPNRLPGLTGVPTSGLALRMTNYRPVDTGPRTYTVTDDMFRVLGGLRGKRDGWDWETAFGYSWARTDDNTHNAISNTLFQQALARSTPDAYNPFNGGNQGNYSLGDGTLNNPATIRSFLVEVHRISETSLATWDFKVSRPDLFALPAGDVGVASGVEVRHETYSDNRDNRLDGTTTYTDMVSGITYGTDIMGASPAPDVSADRTISSLFLELAVPVVSPDMNIPLVHAFDLQLAGRDEYYSDFGNVIKPKMAASWTVIKGVMLRGSVSQSFRAPNLPQFYSAGTQVSNTRTDYAFCRLNNTTCSGASTLEVRSGNQNLRPEEADNASAGVVLQPTFIPPEYGNFLVTVDYWSIREKDVIGLQGAQNQILYDYLLRQQGKSNPNVVRLDPAQGQSVGQISYVEDDYFNVQPRQVRGVDFEVDYDLHDTPVGSFSVRLNASKLLKWEQQASDLQKTLIAANAAGQLGPGVVITGAGSQIAMDGNPKWRASATLNWRQGPWRAGAQLNYVGPVNDTGPTPVNGQFFQVKSWTTLNLYGEYDFDRPGLFDKSSIKIGVRNVADKVPPLDSNNFGYLGSLHNALGRYSYVEVSKQF
jgi:outer membrane receptor protein involved in Fe transport